MSRNKKATAFAMLLILSIALTLVALPSVNAQSDYRTKKTYAYVGATPNPVGVGQETLIHVGITDYLLTQTDGWQGLTVTVTKPDGTTETLGPLRTDSTGGTGTVYIPHAAGTYTLQTHFPAQWFNWTRTPAFSTNIYGNIWYDASDSEKLTLVVQEEPILPYPGSPLPTEYWTRPINAQHHEWSAVSSNWVTAPDNLVAKNNDGPETAHILWAKPFAMGGLAGGDMGPHAFECGDAYEGFFSGSTIIGGVLYYNLFKSSGGSNVEQIVVAVDLHTGEELWARPLIDPDGNSDRLSFGQVFYWDSYNYHAAFDYLWSTSGSTWDAYDAHTGRWEYRMTDVPTSSVQFGPTYSVRGPLDEIYIYNVNTDKGWMALWNSSRVGSSRGSWGSAVTGRALDGTRGYEWNVTIPTGLPGTVRNIFFGDRIIGSDAAGWMTMDDLPVNIWCINLKPGLEGQLMFNVSWNPPAGDYTFTWGTSYGGSPSLEDKVFIISCKETRAHYGFSLDTGLKIWGPTESQHYLDIFGMANIIADGKLISARMGGVVYAYDIKTGETLWTYEATDHYNEILWGNNWPVRPLFIADGKLYLGHSEHSPVDPKPRGAPFICLDVETGEEVWRIDGAFRVTDWGGRSIIGDSIIATYDSYDQRIYAIGKGPTATTVTIRSDSVAQGSTVLIQGTVMDVSSGTEDYALRARFPDGVPAVSDESMSEWMKHVYIQFERPMDIEGVEVTLSVVDENGNYREIGKTTSSSDGFYSFAWTPDITGKYMVYASFAGSEAYWPSHAEAAFVVDEAGQQAKAPEFPAQVDNTMTIVGVGVAILAAIAVVGTVIMLMLRKKS